MSEEKTTEDFDEIDVDLDDEGEESQDDTDWKAEALKARGLAKRYKSKLDKSKEEKPEEKKETKEEKSADLDYGQKAYLVANGIKGKDEIALVKEYMASGKDLDDIIENKHFQNDLKDLRENKATKEAMPTGSKRSSSAPRDTVEYWIAKGELPPVDQAELRTKVVNAKLKASTDGGKFYNQK